MFARSLALFFTLSAVACVSPERNFGAGGAGGAGGGGGVGGGGGGTARAQGEACTAAAECDSGFCADGVCCGEACDGECKACSADVKGYGDDGVCGAAAPGTDPHSDCEEQPATTCGTTGLCGVTGCAKHTAGTICTDVTCQNGVKSLPDKCDGQGTCADGGTQSCANGMCDSGGAVCSGDCTSNADCQASEYCDPAGDCLAKVANGGACNPQEAAACSSGACVLLEQSQLYVCCDSGCSGTCSSCEGATTGGPDGQCLPITAGTDPSNECGGQPAATCGDDGMCDGAGACRKHQAGTVCMPGGCAGGIQFSGDTCDGIGNCVDGGQVGCGNYQCGASTCKSSCTVAGDCAAGATCQNGQCLNANGLGNPCSAAGECGSGFCVDDVCCESACGSACQACSAAKKGGGADGDCDFVSLGSDPDAECADQGAASCGTTGACNGAGACAVYPNGTLCVASSCANGTQFFADTCNGSGTCSDGGSTSCGNYACNGSVCASSCGSEANCAPGMFCAGGACQPKKGNGVGCGVGSECQSGNCVDGVCCDSGCGGVCKTCGSGTCTNAAAGSDPDNECAAQAASTCGLTGACNGGGACESWPNGTQCAAQDCAGGVQTNAKTCSGGSCSAGGGQVGCGPYICQGSACGTSCSVAGDCAGGLQCISNVCQPPQPNGSPCMAAGQCQSGFCADGFCCNTACAGLCNACDGSGFDPVGICGPLDCSFTCGAGKVCNGSGSCVNGAPC